MLDFDLLTNWYNTTEFGVSWLGARELAEAHQHEFPYTHPLELTDSQIQQVRNYAKYSQD